MTKQTQVIVAVVGVAGGSYLVWRYLLGGDRFLAQRRVEAWAAGTATRQRAEATA